MTKYTKAMSQEEMLSRLKSLHIELRYMVDAVEAIKKNIEYKYYINGIKTLEEDDDWIPCSERLPDNDDWVLGTVRYWDKAEDPIDEAFYAVERLFYDGKWRIAGGSEVEQYDDTTVLAWQPMPEPYKGYVEKAKERKIPLYAYASWDRSEK